MSNVEIRRALAHAIDFKEMAETKLMGLTEFNPSGVAGSSAYFDKSFQAWPKYDPEAARKLLKEAGYKGEPIKMQTNKRYIGMYENAVVVQAMLNAAGFNVQLDVIDWAAQLENWMSGKFQLRSFGYSSRADPMLMYGTIIGNKAKAPTSQWDDAERAGALSQGAKRDGFRGAQGHPQAAPCQNGGGSAHPRALLLSRDRGGLAEARELRVVAARKTARLGRVEKAVICPQRYGRLEDPEPATAPGFFVGILGEVGGALGDGVHRPLPTSLPGLTRQSIFQATRVACGAKDGYAGCLAKLFALPADDGLRNRR